MNWAPVWSWIGTNSSVVSASATVATAAIAIAALLSAARDSRERSRPMVLAEFRRAENSDSAIDLVVRNAGPSVAREVQVSFEPEPVLPQDSSGLVTPYLLKRYQGPIPSLSPGKELHNIWFSGAVHPDGGNELHNTEPTSDEVTVRLTYRGGTASGLPGYLSPARRRHPDDYILNLVQVAAGPIDDDRQISQDDQRRAQRGKSRRPVVTTRGDRCRGGRVCGAVR